MYLIASPTELEISKLKEDKNLRGSFNFLTTGFGMLESSISLTKFFSEHKVEGVILFGVCGAYVDSGIEVLDICLAEREFIGDFGVAMNNEVEYFTSDILKNKYEFDLKNKLFNKVEKGLGALKLPYKSGNFVTVNSCSGTLKRGNFLRDKFNAICENMEGTAIAKVCELYYVPLVEMRCVSNMVENRDKSKWKTEEAIEKSTAILTKILRGVIK